MSQTLQNQLLLAKSMNGIISFDDGAGTTIQNGQVITNGINTDNITTNGLNATDMAISNLTVSTSANVPNVPLEEAYSTKAANTNYVNDYVASKIKQDEYTILTLSTPTSYVEWATVNWKIDNDTVTTITIGEEAYYAAVGYRYNIFPSKEWSELAPSITVNTESGSSFIYNNQEVTSFTMSANNPSISMICISIAGAGNICWVVTDRDPNTILSSDNTWTGTNTFQEQTVLTDTVCLTGNMDLPSNTSLITTTSIGNNTLQNCTATAYAENITAIGAGVMQVNASAGTNNTAIGAEAFGQATNLGAGNVAIGYRSGYGGLINQNISNCTFIGNNTGIGTINPITNSIAIGNGAIVSASNNIVLGGTGLLVIIPSNMQKGTSFIERASGTIISANYTLPTTLFTYYSINSVSSFSITFPAASLTYVSNRMTFKRISGNPANSITSASANIYQLDGTVSNQLLPPNVYSVTLVSMFLTGSPTFTYGWVIIEQDRNASYVDLTTNQNVFGVKTFEDGIVVSDFLNISTTDFKLIQNANQQIIIKDNTTSKVIIRFNNSDQSIALGLDALLNETLAGNRNNVAIGTNALKTNTIGRYSVAIGVNALTALTGASYSQNIAIGYQSLLFATNCADCIAIGVNTGHQVLTGSRNTFIGTGTNFSSATQHNDSTAIGYGSLITASNQVMLGRSTETVVCPGTLQLKEQIQGASPSVITSNFSLTSGTVYRYYSIACTIDITCTLPTANATSLSTVFTFRRTGGTTTTLLTNSAATIYPINSITPGVKILDTGVYTATVVCMLIDAAPTYGWVIVG
jgi:hypothetical protein